MKKLKSKKLTFSSSERRKIKDIIRTSLRTDTSVQTVFKGPIRFINQNEFNLTVDNPKARRKVIRALKKAVDPMRLVIRFRGPVVIGVKHMSKPKKVLNPISGKYISVEGPTCKRMLKEGFTIVKGILKPPKNYMRKNKKAATLIIVNREITKIKEKIKNAPPEMKPKLEEIVTKLENEVKAPLQIPSETKAPNLKRSNNVRTPLQLPSNTKAPNLKRSNNVRTPLQLPSNTRAPGSRRSSNSSMRLPSNTRAPEKKSMWSKIVDTVLPPEKKPENLKAKEFNQKTYNVITKLQK